MDKNITHETEQKDQERKSLRKKLMELKSRKISHDSQTNSSEYDSSPDGGRGHERLESSHTEAGLNPEELAGYINQLMADLEIEREESEEEQPIMLQIPFLFKQ